MGHNRNNTQGINMINEDRRLIVETLGEMRELKGEMKPAMGKLAGTERICYYW
jgi:hypothetical protein